jgi:hypothetical protein
MLPRFFVDNSECCGIPQESVKRWSLVGPRSSQCTPPTAPKVRAPRAHRLPAATARAEEGRGGIFSHRVVWIRLLRHGTSDCRIILRQVSLLLRQGLLSEIQVVGLCLILSVLFYRTNPKTVKERALGAGGTPSRIFP